jgi:hypothetical protein
LELLNLGAVRCGTGALPREATQREAFAPEWWTEIREFLIPTRGAAIYPALMSLSAARVVAWRVLAWPRLVCLRVHAPAAEATDIARLAIPFACWSLSLTRWACICPASPADERALAALLARLRSAVQTIAFRSAVSVATFAVNSGHRRCGERGARGIFLLESGE